MMAGLTSDSLTAPARLHDLDFSYAITVGIPLCTEKM